ncbi:conserved protein of unknown function [Methylacidimicrobium sp. AP8]|nr:conserved protein of unknown function [Methylacidimicrobium sp. AP8]
MRIRPGFLLDATHRLRVGNGELPEIRKREPSGVGDRTGAALLGGSGVEKGVGAGGQDSPGSRGGFAQIAGLRGDGAAPQLAKEILQPVRVHRLRKAVAQRLLDQRVVGAFPVAAKVFGAGDRVGEDRPEQLLGLHPLEKGRDPAPSSASSDRERDRGGPAPADREHRAGQERLDQDRADRLRVEEREDLLERKAMRVGKREKDRILGRRRLQLEVELSAEALAEREPPGAIDPAPEGRMDDELGSARRIEKALDRDASRMGDEAEGRSGGRQIGGELSSGAPGEADPPLELFAGVFRRVGKPAFFCFRKPLVHAAADPAGTRGELAAAAGQLPEPERNRGSLSAGVFDADDPALDLAQPPRGVAQREDISGKALDRKVLVHRSQGDPLRFRDDGVLPGVRNRAAAQQGGQPSALAREDAVAGAVPEKEGAAALPPRRVALRQHRHDAQKFLAAEPAIRIGPPDRPKELLFVPRAGGHLGDDLLGEDVEGGFRDHEPVEDSLPDGQKEPGALDQLVLAQRKEPPFGDRFSDPVGRSADPLEKGSDRPRRAELADKVDLADVDAELQGGGGDENREPPGLQPLLGRKAPFPAQAPVMGGHRRFPEASGQVVGDPLGEAAAVDEDKGCPAGADQIGQAIVDLFPDLGREDRLQRGRGQLDRDLHLSPRSEVDDGAGRRSPLSDPGKEVGQLADRPLGRRKPDALEGHASQGGEPFQGKGEVGPPLSGGHGVDLVEDDDSDRGEQSASAAAAEKEVERLRGGHQEMGRPAEEPGALRRRGVPGACADPDFRGRDSFGGELPADAGQRFQEVALDVVGEGTERRDVEDGDLRAELPGLALAHKLVDRRKKGGQGLPRARRRGEEDRPAALDERPGRRLDRGRGSQRLGKPVTDGGMKVHALPALSGFLINGRIAARRKVGSLPGSYRVSGGAPGAEKSSTTARDRSRFPAEGAKSRRFRHGGCL